jgi:HSP20 family protein
MNTTVQKESAPTPTVDRNNGQFVAPDVNIYETKDGYTLEAEMPGVNKEGLNLGQPLFRERRQAGYRRVFELDPVIDTARISARMNQGVLYLTLPKSEQVKPRKIAVAE